MVIMAEKGERLGNEIVRELRRLGVTRWRIHRFVGVSYKTVKCWEKDFHGVAVYRIGKLQELMYRVQAEQSISFFAQKKD